MDYQEAMERHKKDCRRCRERICEYNSRNFSCLQNTDIKAYEELIQYKQLGTLEEVRKTMEKQKEKKPIIQPWSPARCPSCGDELSDNLGDGYYRHRTFLKRCTNAECAQRLDWSEEE